MALKNDPERTYSEIAIKQLRTLEAKVKDMPPGDVRARLLWMVEHTRSRINQLDAHMDQGKETFRVKTSIESLFGVLEKEIK